MMNANMIEPRCLIRAAIDSRCSFPDVFAGKGKWFRRRVGIVSSGTRPLASHALAAIDRHLNSPQPERAPAGFPDSRQSTISREWGSLIAAAIRTGKLVSGGAYSRNGDNC
jgi:hypothetical protein